MISYIRMHVYFYTLGRHVFSKQWMKGQEMIDVPNVWLTYIYVPKYFVMENPWCLCVVCLPYVFSSHTYISYISDYAVPTYWQKIFRMGWEMCARASSPPTKGRDVHPIWNSRLFPHSLRPMNSCDGRRRSVTTIATQERGGIMGAWGVGGCSNPSWLCVAIV